MACEGAQYPSNQHGGCALRQHDPFRSTGCLFFHLPPPSFCHTNAAVVWESSQSRALRTHFYKNVPSRKMRVCLKPRSQSRWRTTGVGVGAPGRHVAVLTPPSRRAGPAPRVVVLHGVHSLHRPGHRGPLWEGARGRYPQPQLRDRLPLWVDHVRAFWRARGEPWGQGVWESDGRMGAQEETWGLESSRLWRLGS